MKTWHRLPRLSLIVFTAQCLCLGSMALAQGEAVKPKPREEEKPRAVKPKKRESPSTQTPTSGSVEDEGLGEVRIGILPFFGDTERFDEQHISTFDGWFKDAVEMLLSENDFGSVDHQWIKESKVKDKVFEELPTSRIRGAADLLKPLAKKGLEGIIGSWIEGKPDSDELVVVFYLPERIKLQEYMVSANFERATLEEDPDVGYAEEPTRNLMIELLRRNLRRVTPIAGPAHTPPPSNPPPAGAPSDGSGHDSTNDLEEGVEEENGGPKTFAVLHFSREFLTDHNHIKKHYSESPIRFPFGKTTESILVDLGVQRVTPPRDPDPVTYDQIDAPLLDLDPNADPNAREKSLFARAGPKVDTLVFGHLRQESKVNNNMNLKLYLRLLKKSDYQYYMAEPREWPKGKIANHWREETIRTVLRGAILEVIQKAGIDVGIDVSMVGARSMTLRRGHTLFRIAKWCYGETETEDTMRTLAQVNNLKSYHVIRKGESFTLPAKIGQHSLQNRKQCR